MNDKLKTFQGPDGELYRVSAEGFARLLRSPGAGKLKKGKTKKGIGPAGGAPVSKKTGKVFTGHKGTKRSIGPAGAPVSKKTGKVFAGANIVKKKK